MVRVRFSRLSTTLLLALVSVSLADVDGDWTYSVADDVATILSYSGAGGGVSVPIKFGDAVVRNFGNNQLPPVFGFDNITVTGVTIDTNVTSIGDHAFRGCTLLTNVAIPGSVTNIGNFAFRNCSQLPTVAIPNSVTAIGNDAFFNCVQLASVAIPGSVTTIGNGAFGGCVGLTNFTIGAGVASIGESAFGGCEGLTSMTIPGSVTNIGDYAFSECLALASIVFTGGLPSRQPASLGSSGTIYYLSEYASVWPPTFGGLPTALFAPTVDYVAGTTAGGFRFQWIGSANVPMNVQRTTSLSGLSGGTWSNVAAGITNGDFTDPNPPAGAAFYRAVLP
jgi:hypothetical protein